MKLKYKKAFMDMAERFAMTSEATRLKVGAIIVKDGNIISHAINGTPRGFSTNECEAGDGSTAWWTFHAEAAALNKLSRSTETSLKSDIFITHAPCRLCALRLIDAGITKVYYRNTYRDTTGLTLLKEHGIGVEVI
jgi:dCMP deaminase